MTAPQLSVSTQGGGVVTADNLNTYTQWCLNVANLRAFVGVSDMTVLMLGTTTPSDGGQGYFWWNPFATVPDDNGVTTIQPSSVTGAGRWNRLPITVSSIPANAIQLTQIQQIPADTLLGNNLGTPGNVVALTIAQVEAMLGGAVLPTGTVVAYAAQGAPTGWLVCDGSAVSRTTYPNLNALASSAGYLAPWGAGDGSTTFNVPNLLGDFIRGWDSGGTVDPGRTFGSEQTGSMQAHQHISDTPTVFVSPGYSSPFGNTSVSTLRVGFTTAGTGNQPYGLTNDGTTYSSFNPNPGGQIGNEVRPINVALGYIIKT